MVGCRSCTRNQVLRSLASTSLLGWWCLPWGLGTPALLVQNAVVALRDPDEAALRSFLAAQGLDPDAVQLDEDGMTEGQRRLVDAVLGVLHQMMWADGHAAPREIEVAERAAIQVLGDAVEPATIRSVLSSPESPPIRMSELSDDALPILFRAAAAVAAADGIVEDAEMGALRKLGAQLGLSDQRVERTIEKVKDAVGASAEQDDMREIAAQILDCTVDTPAAEIQASYRAKLLEIAGDQQADPEDLDKQTTRLKWAYHTLM